MFEWGVILACFIISAISLSIAVWALVQVEALKRSTHQVTFLDPTKQAFESLTDEVREKLTNI